MHVHGVRAGIIGYWTVRWTISIGKAAGTSVRLDLV